MKKIFTLSSLLLSASTFAADAPKKMEFNICYFSLNKSDEYDLTKGFMDKLNANSMVKINVTEFQPDKDALPKEKKSDAIPNAAFKKMVESGTKCDGLVISGHHTGSYGGKRTYDKTRLTMDYMESLSCLPKYKKFFENINAVWLQGCRTLGVGTIVAGQENDQRFDAAFHTARVGNAVEEDQLGQNYAQLQTEFTNTLDQDNPLSSRYLRLFPSAKLFGWTQTAPGDKANSQYSVLYHIAHMAKIMDDGDQFPKESPASPTLTADSVARYVDGVMLALSHFGQSEQRCEELATAAWIAHGSKKSSTDRYAFDNADLAAFTPLNSTGNEALQTMKGLECKLKDAARNADINQLGAVLDIVNARPELLPYAFNSLVDIRNQLLRAAAADKTDDGKKKKALFAQTILDRMGQNPQVKGFLESKINSKQVGTMRKIDYYRFYTSLTGNSSPAVQAEIEARILEELKRPLPRTSQTSRMLARDYRKTLLESGLKNKLLSPNIGESILALNPEWDVLEAMGILITSFPGQDVNAKIDLLTRAGSLPQSNSIAGGEIMQGVLNMVKTVDDPRYYRAYGKVITPYVGKEDYWHGEIHEGNNVIPAMDLALIPPAGTLGGPPGQAGAAAIASNRPAVSGQPVAVQSQTPAIFQPLEDAGNFFKRIFQN